MYEPRNYEIRETSEIAYGIYRPSVRIDVAGLDSLPHVLRRLSEMGYDLTDAHKALTEAVEEQRKRKALDEAVKAMTAKAAE